MYLERTRIEKRVSVQHLFGGGGIFSAHLHFWAPGVFWHFAIFKFVHKIFNMDNFCSNTLHIDIAAYRRVKSASHLTQVTPKIKQIDLLGAPWSLRTKTVNSKKPLSKTYNIMNNTNYGLKLWPNVLGSISDSLWGSNWKSIFLTPTWLHFAIKNYDYWLQLKNTNEHRETNGANAVSKLWQKL